MCCCRLQSCGCCALREGSIAVGIIDLLLSLAGIGLQVWPIVEALNSGGTVVVGAYSWGYIGVYGISVLFAILLIIGAVKNNACLCLAWIIWSSICLALSIALAVWLCFAIWGTNLALGAASGSGVGAAIIGAIAIGLYIAIGILVVVIIFLIIGIMVVNSFRQELNEGGGYPGSYPMQAV